MRVRVLDELIAEGAPEVLGGLGWQDDARALERVGLSVLRAATPEHNVERLRLETNTGVVEAELPLGSNEPHQLASIRLQCAIAASSFGRAGLLVHAAGLVAPGRGGVVALARSGGGKSTLSNLSTRFEGLSDETVLLQPGPPPLIRATPFRSMSEKVPSPRTEPLRAMLILEKSLQPSFTRVDPKDAVPILLAQAYAFPPELSTTAARFKQAAALVANVPAFRFAFPKAPEAQELLERLLASLG